MQEVPEDKTAVVAIDSWDKLQVDATVLADSRDFKRQKRSNEIERMRTLIYDELPIGPNTKCIDDFFEAEYAMDIDEVK